MVVKRQCSFCANEIEPGTGIMYIKRDGAVYYFCSGSCRKHQFKLNRVGHRLKWTRAHILKRESAKSGHVPASKAATPAKTVAPAKPAATPKPAVAKAAAPAPKAATPAPKPAAPAKPAAKDSA